jgi:CheY-like chemotaxis protein
MSFDIKDLTSGNDDHILVAEDSSSNRMIIVMLLKKLGLKVLQCEDGAVAWKTLDASRNIKIVAVISDLMMPNLDGLGLLRKCREDEKYKSVPFILATAVNDRDSIMTAKDLRVNGYIIKPVTHKMLIDKLRELFPEKQFAA